MQRSNQTHPRITYSSLFEWQVLSIPHFVGQLDTHIEVRPRSVCNPKPQTEDAAGMIFSLDVKVLVCFINTHSYKFLHWN